MKVIIKKSLPTLGSVGDVVKVKDGYARNYLFPNNLAAIANKQNIKNLEIALAKKALEEAKSRESNLSLANQLNKESLKFEVKVDENENLFGSVTDQMIYDMLIEKEYKLEKKEINLLEPIKTLGKHKVEIVLDKEIKGTILVKVIKEK
tara:strand:- start:151 stop:597 length:447 start_codon:yes stop_codon:yes gene_type:complete